MASKQALQLLTLDFETYYDDEYSLRKMTTEEYVRDPRFEIILVGLKFNDRPEFWISGTHEHLRQKLSQIAWDKVICLGHNMSGFDALVLTEVLGFYPAFWQCTLSIGRAIHGGESVSLAALAKKYGLRNKGTEVDDAKGKRRADFSPAELRAYGTYCEGDVEICYDLYHLMRPRMPVRELRTIHVMTRMFAEPRIELDAHGLRQLRTQLEVQKANLLEQCDVTQQELRSDAKFAELLRAEGIEPGMKWPKKRAKEAEGLVKQGIDPTEHGITRKYAFAKTDKFMEELGHHPSQRVQILRAARLKTKTTIEESRVERFIGIASRGYLPAPILYGKTVTHRAAGGGKINLQNMGRPRPVSAKSIKGTLLATSTGLRTLNYLDSVTGNIYTDEGDVFSRADLSSGDKTCHEFGLRDAIRAPQGYKVVPVDSSNIELRVCHMLCGQMDTIERVRSGEDLYSWFASDLYGKPIDKKNNPVERQHGKVGMLQLQFQSGAGSFQTAARVQGGVELSLDESQMTVDMFRGKFPMIVQMWKHCQRLIPDIFSGVERPIDQWGLCHTTKNAIVLPNGMRLDYLNLRQEEDPDWGMQWVYDDKETRKPKKLYGGQVVQHMTQALARIVVFDQGLVIENRWGRTRQEGVVLYVHDENVLIVRDAFARPALDDSIQIMSTPPAWWPGLPVAAEGDIAQTYGDAK